VSAARLPAAGLRALAAAALALLLSGCALEQLTPNAVQPAAPNVPLPPAAPRVSGVETASQREHKRLVEAFGGEYRAPAMQALLQGVTERLSRAETGQPDRFRLTLLNSPMVNAFALPNGNIYLTRGLLALANDTAEIASVIAHEMAHVVAAHAIERAELERVALVRSRVADDLLQDPVLSRAVRTQQRVAIASFSRQQELEADALSVRIAARAGFDVFGAPRFLTALGRSTALRAAMLGQAPEGAQMDITATHPATPERIRLVTLAAREISAPGLGENDRNAYLTALSGLSVGDDPSEGVVRARTFAHPRLGITFTAPEGFVLENSRSAVLGLAPASTAALRFDTARVPVTTSLESYLASGLIEGSPTTDIETLTVDGLPAATGIARSEDWTYRLFVIRSGGTIYRMIQASRSFTPALDQAFREAATSFRRLSQDEIARIRPLRVVVVTAGPGDTAATMAARMAFSELKEDRFRLLNGLADDEEVKAGTRYKLVVD
jgi:predicted Zn-dependent protease